MFFFFFFLKANRQNPLTRLVPRATHALNRHSVPLPPTRAPASQLSAAASAPICARPPLPVFSRGEAAHARVSDPATLLLSRHRDRTHLRPPRLHSNPIHMWNVAAPSHRDHHTAGDESSVLHTAGNNHSTRTRRRRSSILSDVMSFLRAARRTVPARAAADSTVCRYTMSRLQKLQMYTW